MSVAIFWLLLISDPAYAACNATTMAFRSAALAGSPLGFEAVFAPECTTAPGGNVLAPRRGFPLNRSDPESVPMGAEAPAALPLFVRMPGTARTKVIPPVLTFAVSPPKFPLM
jgi:hypothetical protein